MKTRNEPAALSAKNLRAAFYAHNHGAYALSVLATALTQALVLGISWILMEMINAISGEAGAKSLENLALMIAVYLLLFTLVSLLNRAAQPRFLRTAMEQYKNLVLQKLMGKSLASFQREPTSAYLSALSNDAAVIERDYLEAEFQIIGNLLDFCGAFLLMLYLSPLLTAVVAVLTVLPMAASMGVGRRLEPLERRVSEDNASFTAALKDCLSGFPVVKSFRSEGGVFAPPIRQKWCAGGEKAPEAAAAAVCQHGEHCCRAARSVWRLFCGGMDGAVRQEHHGGYRYRLRQPDELYRHPHFGVARPADRPARRPGTAGEDGIPAPPEQR